MHLRRFVLGAKWRLFGVLQSAYKSRNSRSKNTASAIMRGIGNKQQKQAQARDWNLKPSQIASDEDGAVMGKGTNVFGQIGHPAAAISGGQVLKPCAPSEQNVETAFSDSEAKFGLLVKGCSYRKRFVEPSDRL